MLFRSLMRAAEHRGLTAVGGLALLVQQAALSFAHFTGIVPDAALCRDILQELEAAQQGSGCRFRKKCKKI